jgi:hypothetical protein
MQTHHTAFPTLALSDVFFQNKVHILECDDFNLHVTILPYQKANIDTPSAWVRVWHSPMFLRHPPAMHPKGPFDEDNQDI